MNDDNTGCDNAADIATPNGAPDDHDIGDTVDETATDSGAQRRPAEEAADRLRAAIDRIRSQNRARLGTLTLHTRQRDIELTVDGDAALRAIATFAGKPGYQDELTPEMDSSWNGWVGIDFDQLVAISWSPVGGDRRPGRSTIDPRA